MELIDKQALREKLKDKICIFPAAIRRAIDEAPVVYEVEVSNRANLQDHIMSLIPDTIDTDAGTHTSIFCIRNDSKSQKQSLQVSSSLLSITICPSKSL